MEPVVPRTVDRRTFLVAAAATAPALVGGRAIARIRPAAETLDAFIRTEMEHARVPGLAAAVVRDNGIAWARGYGWANAAHMRSATPDTAFMLASISKTVMATAAMQAVEDGILRLDADVNDVVPFSVRHPAHPDVPITLRHLLTHTAGIRDNWGVITPTYAKGDSRVPLKGYLRRYLAPGGDIYHPNRNYERWPPGTRYRYCNIGASLAGYLVEAASGMGFDRWCNERIFAPLGMTNTGWHLADVQRSTVAMPYRSKDGRFVPYGQYGYPDYPDGELRTSARHLANHLMSFIGGGAHGGHRVLRRETVREMRRDQFPEVVEGQGLIWYRTAIAGMPLMGHNGGDSGVATQMYFRPADDIGVIVLTNGDWHKFHHRWPLQRILARLFDDAETL